MTNDKDLWKKQLIAKFEERNQREVVPYRQLIVSVQKLYENSEIFRARSVELASELATLRAENTRLSLRAESGGASSEQVQRLQQKVYDLQEELTTLHRKRDENSSELVRLTRLREELTSEISDLKTKIAGLEQNNAALKEAREVSDAKLRASENANQLLRDEYQALNTAHLKLTERMQLITVENDRLIEQVTNVQQKLAEKYNQENDDFARAQKLKNQRDLERELEQAAARPLNVNLSDAAFAACLHASIPNRAVFKWEAHDGEVNCVRWTPSGKMVATGGADRKVKLWLCAAGRCELRQTLVGCNAAVHSVDFDSLEQLCIAASSTDYAVRVWTIGDGRLRYTLTGHGGKVLAAKCADQSIIVSGSADRTVKLWDLREGGGACTRTYLAGSSCSDLVLLGSFGAFQIVSCHYDKKLRVWDSRQESAAREISFADRPTSVVVSTDGTILMASFRDNTLKRIELRQGVVSQTYAAEQLGFHVGSDYVRAALSPDGIYTACGSAEGGLFVWNVASGKLEKCTRCNEHANSMIVACDWRPSGAEMVTVDNKKRAVLWDSFG